MVSYQTKCKKITGTDFDDIASKAYRAYRDIQRKSHRRPYIRSAYGERSELTRFWRRSQSGSYFKRKVFLDYFWPHLNQKSRIDRRRRMALLPCAFELIRHSRSSPSSKVNANRKSEILHRFTGVISSKQTFQVQIKEDLKSKRLFFMSVYPFK